MAASLNALTEVATHDPRAYKNLVPSFVSILKQVVEGKLPRPYEYHKAPAPFIQVCNFLSSFGWHCHGSASCKCLTTTVCISDMKSPVLPSFLDF